MSTSKEIYFRTSAIQNISIMRYKGRNKWSASFYYLEVASETRNGLLSQYVLLTWRKLQGSLDTDIKQKIKMLDKPFSIRYRCVFASNTIDFTK
jgi:hypothetical protein